MQIYKQRIIISGLDSLYYVPVTYKDSFCIFEGVDFVTFPLILVVVLRLVIIMYVSKTLLTLSQT